MKTALQRGHVVVCAPPGYGKTILLRSLLAEQPGSHYLALTHADIDLAQIKAKIEPLLAADATLLIDDIHLILDAKEALAWVQEQLRQRTARFVLSGRQLSPSISTPGVGMPVTQFSLDDLVFTRNEAAALLPHLPASQSREWHERTQGWALALALLTQPAALQLNARSPVAFEQHDALFAYLAATVIETLPADLLNYMQITAIPLRFDDELAAHLLELPLPHAYQLRVEMQQRNLFIETVDSPDWFRYHDLIRTFLIMRLQGKGNKLNQLYERIVDWFETKSDLPAAIEHALIGSLQQRATQLIQQLPPQFSWNQGRYLTMYRWVSSLDESGRAAMPRVLMRLGRDLHQLGLRKEGWEVLNAGVQVAEADEEPEVVGLAQMFTAALHIAEGNPRLGIIILEELAATATSALVLMRAYYQLGAAYVQESRYDLAQRAMLETNRRAAAVGDKTLLTYNSNNLASVVWLPLGKYAAAKQMLALNDLYFQENPGGQSTNLLAWVALYEGMGDWAAVASTLNRICKLEDQSEQPDESTLIWVEWWRTLMYTALDDLEPAENALEKARTMAHGHAERLICIETARAWLERRHKNYAGTIEIVDSALKNVWPSKLYRGILGLEREIAYFFGTAEQQPKSVNDGEEWRLLINLRARPWLVRLRALLALRCHRAGNPRWRRHINAVLRSRTRFGYEKLLITREPDLGAHFWALCVAEGSETEFATVALKEIGQIEPITNLLAAQSPARKLLEIERSRDWEIRLIDALVAIGKETAIPVLMDRLEGEKDKTVVAALEAALDQLESAPPPKLEITLLGGFQVKSDGIVIDDAVWQRPAAKRLFQYFALHHGESLTRDRILDDLWPSSDPQQARASFRTITSWLRKAIEPYLRAKAPSRYLSLKGDMYCFNPLRNAELVAIDVETFEQTIKGILVAVEAQDVPSLPADLLLQLSLWQPLLPDLQYESWTLEARERVQESYVQGCLYVATSLLVLDRPAEAMPWAERAIKTAPWLEEGYQALMRAHARLGQRTLALKTYADCVAALKRELDVPPSRRTEWIAKRLRTDEEV